MRSAVTVCIAVTFGLFIAAQTTCSLYAQSPLKDLRTGNIFYYYYFAGNFNTGYFFEKVIGDTVIRGQKYAKVYSDPWRIIPPMPRITRSGIDTIRFERANDSAIYEWVAKENKEYVRLRNIPAYEANDKFYLKTPIFDCSVGCTVAIERRRTGSASWQFLYWNGSNMLTIDYALTMGISRISNGLDNQFRQIFNRIGAAFVGEEIFPSNGATINFIQQLDTLLQTSRITVGVREQEAATSLTLAPNPVGDEANVTFSLASSKRVRLVVVDNLGRVLLSVADAQLPAGEHRFPVHTEVLANGVYWLRLWADAGVQTVPLVVRR